MWGTKEKIDTALSECENGEQLANETSKMKQTNVELLEANAELQSKKLITFEHGKYTNELRVCIMDQHGYIQWLWMLQLLD